MMRAAWLWALDQGDLDRVNEGIEGLRLYYERRVRLDEALSVADAALNRLRSAAVTGARRTSQRALLLGRLLTWRSSLLRGDLAHAAVDQALATLSSVELEAEDVRLAYASALLRKARLLLDSDRAGAKELFVEGLVLSRELGDRWLEARFVGGLADHAESVGEYDAYRQWAEEMLEVARSIGDLRAISWALNNLAGAYAMRGDLAGSIRLCEEGLAVAREMGDPATVAGALYLLANKRIFMGQIDDAMSLYRECAEISHDLGTADPLTAGVEAWGHLLEGRYDEASSLADRATVEAEFLDMPRAKGWSYYVQGALALVQGDEDGAIAWFQKSVGVFRPLRTLLYLAITYTGLGYAYRAKGQRGQAFDAYADALRIAVEIGSPGPACFGLPGLALLYADAGEIARAVELRAATDERLSFVANSAWYHDVAGAAYDLAVRSLPADVLEAARSRGRALDLLSHAEDVLSAGWPPQSP